MANGKIGIGIVGFQPGTSWAARAHLPALRALPEDFEIVAVANSTPASSHRAASAIGVRACANALDLVSSRDVDVVVVTVRVPYHFAIVKAAIEAGKHVYCEWPLGNGLAEAEELAELARRQGVLGLVGTQARVAPEIRHIARLLAEGYLGDVVSTTLIGRGGN